jgi:hypothetical protein
MGPGPAVLGFIALNRPPTVDCEVVTFVSPAYSTSTKPVLSIRLVRSPTEIAPPIQFDQASRVPHMGPHSFLRTISAN